jgi:hypothetical protein
VTILIDAHIHIHSSVDITRLLDASWENFTTARLKLFPQSPDCSFALLLSEGKENNIFSSLHSMAAPASATKAATKASWSFVSTGEPNSVLAVQHEKSLLVVAGRQLISSERLELLSLFCPEVFPDNTYTLRELAERVSAAGGTPLLAWGVGKWLGKRGKIIRDFIDQPPVPLFFVGDNGNRPQFWPYPKLLLKAEEQGIMSLAGSDSLPITDHELRAGSFGTGIEDINLQRKHPARELQQLLGSKRTGLPFGKLVGYKQFIFDQLQVNLQKRLG